MIYHDSLRPFQIYQFSLFQQDFLFFTIVPLLMLFVRMIEKKQVYNVAIPSSQKVCTSFLIHCNYL